jgi:signal transduction histidine kinase/CheY-like chemotaxis protein
VVGFFASALAFAAQTFVPPDLLTLLQPPPLWAHQVQAVERGTPAPAEADLHAHMVVSLNDTQSNWSPADAERALTSSDVLRPRSAIQEVGRHRFPGWAAFALKNASEQALDQVIYLNHPTTDFAKLYRWTGASWAEVIGRHDTAIGLFERDRYPSFDITLPAGATHWYMLRQHTVSPMRFTLVAQNNPAHKTDELWKHMVLVPVFLVPIAVGMLLLTLRRLTNTGGQGLFMSFIAADLFGASWLVGILPELLPTVSPLTLRALAQTSYALLAVFGSLHLLRFLDIWCLAPRLSRVVAVATGLFALFIATSAVVDPWRTSSILISGCAITVLTNITLGLYAWRHKRPYSGLYTWAWGVYLLGFVVFVLYKLGWVIPHAWGMTVYLQSAGVCLLIGYAIARSVLDRDSRLAAALEQAYQQRTQIEQLSMERDRLFAAANHDLRQPLQAVALNLELLRTRAADHPELNTIITRMRLALGSMGGMLSALLDLRRADHTGSAPKLEAIELQPLLQRLAIQFREQARAKGLALRLVSSRAWVMADAVWLERALSNLLSNALRYTERGRIVLGVRKGSKNEVRILVIDTGVGIDARDIARLFGEHQSGASTQDVNGKALLGARQIGELQEDRRYGLGLYIVQRLTQAMGARVEVKSIEGKGSQFAIHMQSALPRQVRSQPAAPPEARAQSLLGMHILLLDDDPLTLASLMEALQLCGADVTAESDPGAIRQLLERPVHGFDIVLSDLYFSGYPLGLEFLQLARMRLPEATRMMMTADPEALRKLLIDPELIAKTFSKPISLTDLTRGLGRKDEASVTTPLDTRL